LYQKRSNIAWNPRIDRASDNTNPGEIEPKEDSCDLGKSSEEADVCGRIRAELCSQMAKVRENFWSGEKTLNYLAVGYDLLLEQGQSRDEEKSPQCLSSNYLQNFAKNRCRLSLGPKPVSSRKDLLSEPELRALPTLSQGPIERRELPLVRAL